MRIPILAYQPTRIDGNDYRSNDLHALASDLRAVTGAGFRVMALRSIVDAWLENRGGELEGKVVAFACDHGADFDYLDLPHPTAGMQRSVFNVLQDFATESPRAQPALNVTSFVIASPEARAALDVACLGGKGWWTDAWWKAAIGSGLMHIANQSWDHNHDALPASFSQGARRGTFLSVTSERVADHEIRRAAEYLREHAPNPGMGLFAYPYGQASDFLTRDYFPNHGAELGIRAAFTARAGFLEPGCGKWEVPRFLFGRDWSSPQELRSILDAAGTDRAWVPVRKESAATPLPPAGSSRSEFAAFLDSQVERIPGWLHPEAALLTAHLARVQHESGISGATLEIGVYKGKYLSVLYELSAPGELVLGVDLFVGTGDAQGSVDEVRKNIAEACGDAECLKVVVADSLELTSEALAKELGGERVRFASIDGGHTSQIVLRDLETTYPLLRDGGIVALDDAFNYGTPGVIEGIVDFFRRHEPRLAPFAICYNKVFATTPEFHARYLAEAGRFLEETTWLPMHERSMARLQENREIGFKPMMLGHEVMIFL